MTQSPTGGPAMSTRKQTNPTRIQGGAALRIIPVTDGRMVEGGPAAPVYFVSANELRQNGGQFSVQSNKPVPIIEAGAGIAIAGGAAIPVYDVTGMPDDAAVGYQPLVYDPIGDALRADAVAYWKMDEESGTRVDAGHGNNLSLADGGVSFTDGKIANGVRLVPTGGVLINNNTSVFNMGGRSFSFWGWINIQSLITSYFLSKGDIDDAVEWDFELNGDLEFAFQNMGDGYEQLYVVANSFGSPSADTWLFFVVHTDLNSNEIGIQINNGPIDTTAFTPDNLNGNTPFLFGGSWSSFQSTYYARSDAIVDETGLVYRVLTQSERDYLYNSGAGRALFP